ncbi:translation initiation factor IF-2-like [Dipodomys spectabilis]|uniref:translation initiation factor IF-2-like n=1 Tax=Dipodomys spectabilis TaxID=105255 RepID=UPI001C545DD0|nr:translation initiation factor IF-2-like [Dipodomys spectabilis]
MAAGARPPSPPVPAASSPPPRTRAAGSQPPRARPRPPGKEGPARGSTAAGRRPRPGPPLRTVEVTRDPARAGGGGAGKTPRGGSERPARRRGGVRRARGVSQLRTPGSGGGHCGGGGGGGGVGDGSAAAALIAFIGRCLPSRRRRGMWTPLIGRERPARRGRSGPAPWRAPAPRAPAPGPAPPRAPSQEPGSRPPAHPRARAAETGARALRAAARPGPGGLGSLPPGSPASPSTDVGAAGLTAGRPGVCAGSSPPLGSRDARAVSLARPSPRPLVRLGALTCTPGAPRGSRAPRPGEGAPWAAAAPAGPSAGAPGAGAEVRLPGSVPVRAAGLRAPAARTPLRSSHARRERPRGSSRTTEAGPPPPSSAAPRDPIPRADADHGALPATSDLSLFPRSGGCLGAPQSAVDLSSELHQMQTWLSGRQVRLNAATLVDDQAS